jgi:hypothetical protein
MELVRFKDADGREWEVWEVGVRPTVADRPPPPPTRGPERWLCFESGTERRRLLDYPARWQSMSPRELDALCRAASPRPELPPMPVRPRPEDRRTL